MAVDIIISQGVQNMLKQTGIFLLALLTVSGAFAAGAQLDCFLNWDELLNPVYMRPDWCTKDVSMTWRDGKFYIFHSAFYMDDGVIRSHVNAMSTTDFQTFSEPVLHIAGREDGWIGMCAPDIQYLNGTYYLTFNSWGDKPGKLNQLFYKTSKDLEHWSERKPLAKNLTDGIRAIDVTMTYEAGKYIILYKEKQTMRLAMGDSPDGDFEFIGDGLPQFYEKNGQKIDWHENCNFYKIDGQWYILTVDSPHASHLYRMKGDGSKPEDFLFWEDGYMLDIPQGSYNTTEVSNASGLADWREHDGHFYLIYAGQTDEHAFAGRGWQKLCLARSKDLIHWEAATDRAKVAPHVTITSPAQGASFESNLDIPVKATATDPNGDAVVKMEFFLNDDKVAEDNIAPYEINLDKIPKGDQRLVVRATDEHGNSYATVEPVYFSAGSPRALIVCRRRPPYLADNYIADRLEKLGYAVVCKADGEVETENADSVEIAVVSDSSNSRRVRDKLKEVDIPVIIMEHKLLDDMGMTLDDDGHYKEDDMTHVSLQSEAFGLNAGLSGKVQVYSREGNLVWGIPADSAEVIATLPGQSERAVYFCYQPGDKLKDGSTARGRRVGFFISNDNFEPEMMTDEGWKLFDAAVKWAVE
jgi:hypothetical protein